MILPAGSSTFNVLFYHIEFVWVVLLLNIDDMIGKAFINKAQASAVYVYLYLLHPTSFMAVHNLNSSVGVAFHKYWIARKKYVFRVLGAPWWVQKKKKKKKKTTVGSVLFKKKKKNSRGFSTFQKKKKNHLIGGQNRCRGIVSVSAHSALVWGRKNQEKRRKSRTPARCQVAKYVFWGVVEYLWKRKVPPPRVQTRIRVIDWCTRQLRLF